MSSLLIRSVPTQLPPTTSVSHHPKAQGDSGPWHAVHQPWRSGVLPPTAPHPASLPLLLPLQGAKATAVKVPRRSCPCLTWRILSRVPLRDAGVWVVGYATCNPFFIFLLSFLEGTSLRGDSLSRFASIAAWNVKEGEIKGFWETLFSLDKAFAWVW